MYTCIVEAAPYLPAQLSLSPECKSMVLSLLQKDPSTRLGNNTDLEDIKNHPWMRCTRWDDVKQRRSRQSESRRQSLTQSLMVKHQKTELLDSQKQDLGALLENYD